MEDSSTDSDFETESENILCSFGLLQLLDDDTVQTSTASHSSSSSSALVPLSVPLPLYTDSMWAVNRLSGSRLKSNPQQETITNSNFQFPLAFQANPFEHFSSHDILLLAHDKWGSQYLQEQLVSMDSRIVTKLFWTVFGFVFELMSDQYGRFVFEKFINSCSESQLTLITLKITLQDQLLLQASSDHFGSSSIKKLIKVVAKSPGKSPLLHRVMSALKRLFKFMMMTKPGSSVILQCLDPLYSRKNDFIYQAALEHCLSLACHKQGCINFKSFIDEMKGSRRKQILHLISKNAASLSKNPSGNYVVQHVLKLEDPLLIETICFALRGHYIDLSLTKSGSFVVQKCLQHQSTVHYIVEEFLNGDQILQLASGKYGNYVIQTALAETMRLNTPDLHQRLVSKLQKRRAALQMMKYGSNVYTMIREYHPGLA